MLFRSHATAPSVARARHYHGDCQWSATATAQRHDLDAAGFAVAYRLGCAAYAVRILKILAAQTSPARVLHSRALYASLPRGCSKKVNHEMPPERFFAVTGGKRTRTFVSAARDTQEMPAKSRQKDLSTKTTVKSIRYLAGAGGLEPPNGGIKIHIFWFFDQWMF